jgi:Zn-dependent protease
MGNAFRLGTLFGIQVRLHYTWFIIFVLVTVSLVYPDWSQLRIWVMGIITSLLFFASVLAHELSHSLVGRVYGIPIKSITLFIFGGVAQMTKEATRPGAEFKMAAAGPACSLAIGGLFYLFWLFIPNKDGPMAMMVWSLFFINVALAVFNMIPGFPLDGGRVFRSVLWRATGNYSRSTRIATRVGQGVGYLFILVGIVVMVVSRDWFSGLWLAFIGWFLANVASLSYRQAQWQAALHGFTAAEVMVSNFPVAHSDITVSQLVQDHVFPAGHRFFVVADEGRLQGILTFQNVKSVPQRDWGVTSVREIMTPLDKLKLAYPSQDALSIMEQMNEGDINQMPVVSEGRVIGLVVRDNLLRFLRARSELGVKPG